MTNESEEVLKIVLIGESSVGKTSIITQFIDKSFQDELQSTVGGTFNTKIIKCEDINKRLKLEIWDTAGQERYRSVTRMFYKDTDIALLVYDITKKSSYEALKNYWVQQVIESSLKKTLLVMIANKSDLIDSEQVDEEEARNYAQTIDAHFFLVSAKDLYTVNEMFKDIAKIYSGAKNVSIEDTNEENYFQIQKIRKDSVKFTLKKPEKKKKCC